MPHAKYECTALSQSKVISILEVDNNYETDNSINMEARQVYLSYLLETSPCGA